MSHATPRFAQMSACTITRRLATPIPMRSAFLALRYRFTSGSNRSAASSATTSTKELASMYVGADLVLRDSCWAHVYQV